MAGEAGRLGLLADDTLNLVAFGKALKALAARRGVAFLFLVHHSGHFAHPLRHRAVGTGRLEQRAGAGRSTVVETAARNHLARTAKRAAAAQRPAGLRRLSRMRAFPQDPERCAVRPNGRSARRAANAAFVQGVAGRRLEKPAGRSLRATHSVHRTRERKHHVDQRKADAPVRYHPAPRCPTLTKIVHPSRLNGLCRLMCGLRSQLPAG